MIHIEFVFLKLLTMVAGLLVTLAAYRAYRRYAFRPLFHVAAGFGLISVGVGLEGVIFDFTPLSLYQASLIHSLFMITGMGLILYSIYGDSIATRTADRTEAH